MDCVCIESAASGWYVWKYLKLDQTARDLNCGNWETLFVVTRLGATGLEKTCFVFFQDLFGGRKDGDVMWFSVWGKLLDYSTNGGCVDL